MKTEVQNAFAIAQYTDVMNIEKFARHISTHGSVYSRADIAAILYLAVDCMREQLLEGKQIRLGDLGDFAINLTSKGTETADKFSAQNITGVNVVWTPGMEFKDLLADAECKFRERLNPNSDYVVSFYPSLHPRCGHNHVGFQKCGTLSHIFAICRPPELARLFVVLSS